MTLTVTSPVAFDAGDSIEAQTEPEELQAEHGGEEKLRGETVAQEVADEHKTNE